MRNIPFFILVMVFVACSHEDDVQTNLPDISKTVSGRVASQAGCHTTENELAFTVEIENLETHDFIIVSNLPDPFKEEGLEINFNMEKSMDGFGVCVDLYDPESFYQVSNVELR